MRIIHEFIDEKTKEVLYETSYAKNQFIPQIITPGIFKFLDKEYYIAPGNVHMHLSVVSTVATMTYKIYLS